MKQFEPPISIVESQEFLDGGTIFVRLRDAKGGELLLAVSQAGFEDPVPANTLFLDAVHAYRETARLPLTQAEAELVVGSLENAVHAKLTEQERKALATMGDPAEAMLRERFGAPDDKRNSPEQWSEIYAYDALRRLQGRKDPIDVYSASEAPPKWYAAYDAARAERLAEEERQRKADEEFIACFPKAVHGLFKLKQSDGFDHEEQERRQGALLAKAIDKPVDLALMTCRALGTGHDGWTVSLTQDRIAMFACEGVSGDDFMRVLDKCRDDEIALLGAARLFFSRGATELSFAEKLGDGDRAKCGLNLARTVLKSDLDDEKRYVLAYVAGLNEADAEKLLWQVAHGELGVEIEPSEFDEGPGLRATAYLALARRKAAQAEEEIRSLIDQAEGEDLRAYEVSLAMLGDATFIKDDNFATESTLIAVSAIRAIERFEGAEGMDVLFGAALNHPYAIVANEAVLAAQRLTGQQWIPEGDRAQPRFRRDDATAWWKVNRDAYLAQKKSQ